MNKFLFFLLLGTLFLRASTIGKYGIAGDEKYTLIDSQFLVQDGVNQRESLRNPNKKSFTSHEFWTKKGWPDFLESMGKRENGSGAAYFLGLHYWTNIFGVSDFSLRFPSLLFSLLFLVLAYHYGVLFFNEKVGYIAATLCAISPFLFNYSIIARNYMFTYFWFALSTYALFKILKAKENITYKWHIIYAISLTFCMFGHHSAYIIYVFHIVIFLIEKKYKKIFPLLLSGIPSITLFLLWLNSDGGRYSFEYIKNSNLQYLDWAKNGLIEYSNPVTILNGFLNALSSLSLPFSSHFYYFYKPKQQLIFIALGILLFIVNRLQIKKPIQWSLSLFLILTPFLIFRQFNLYFFTIVFGIYVLIELLWATLTSILKEKNIFYLYFLAFTPILLLIIYSIQDQTVIRLNARYGGYGYMFLILLMAKGVNTLLESKDKIKLIVISMFLFGVVGYETYRIIADKSPLYFHYTPQSRIENPYLKIANDVENIYSIGDTLIHCSQKQATILAGNVGVDEYSYQDAQYIGIYFSKDGKEIVQKIDHNESEKVFLKKKNGEKLLIFDFEDGKYRY